MARHKSAMKQARHAEQRRLINKSNKSRVKSAIKTARATVQEGTPEERQKAIPALQATLDRMSRRGVVHRNKAARLKSRTAKAAAAASKP